MNRRQLLLTGARLGAAVPFIPLLGACGEDTPGTGFGTTATTGTTTGEDAGSMMDADMDTGTTGMPTDMTSTTGVTEDAGPADSEVDTGPTCSSVTTAVAEGMADNGDTDAHTHTVTIPASDVVSGVEKMYTLTGGDHEHTITVTGSQFTMLKGGSTVTVTSTPTGFFIGHTHEVTLSCS